MKLSEQASRLRHLFPFGYHYDPKSKGWIVTRAGQEVTQFYSEAEAAIYCVMENAAAREAEKGGANAAQG